MEDLSLILGDQLFIYDCRSDDNKILNNKILDNKI